MFLLANTRRLRQRSQASRSASMPGTGRAKKAGGSKKSPGLVAEVGDWKAFSSARSLAAWIGLVPKQHSTGGKERLGGISKQGN
jgi:transposase